MTHHEAADGGAVHAYGGGTISIGDTFERNSATSGDGGAIRATGLVTLSGSDFTANTSTGLGAAVYGGGVSVTEGTFVANDAGGGRHDQLRARLQHRRGLDQLVHRPRPLGPPTDQCVDISDAPFVGRVNQFGISVSQNIQLLDIER